LSVSQIQSKSWREELVKQLVLKKFAMSLYVIKLRSSFTKWWEISINRQTQIRNHMLHQSVMHSKEISGRSEKESRERGRRGRRRSSSSSIKRQQRGRLDSDESSTSFCGGSDEATKNQRRLTIRERAPRRMLTTIDSVETASKSTAHVYKNTGMTADELIQHAMGVRHQSLTGLSSSSLSLSTSGLQLPNKAYFLKKAKQQDQRYRPEKITMKQVGGRSWFS
jgi:hypothetical protein